MVKRVVMPVIVLLFLFSTISLSSGTNESKIEDETVFSENNETGKIKDLGGEIQHRFTLWLMGTFIVMACCLIFLLASYKKKKQT